MPTAALSFTVRLARHSGDLLDACRLRGQAYGHHLPEMTQPLARPDALDGQPGTAVLLCRDKASGRAVGTARIQRSQHAPLLLEGSVILPRRLAERPRAEITRLAVAPGADAQVRLALMKAAYLYCLASQVRWLVIGARSDALIRIYRRLGFDDVLGPDDRVPLAHAGHLPHRILAFDVVAAERTWLAAGHGLYPFMIETWHPELQLFDEPVLLDDSPARGHEDGRRPLRVGRRERRREHAGGRCRHQRDHRQHIRRLCNSPRRTLTIAVVRNPAKSTRPLNET